MSSLALLVVLLLVLVVVLVVGAAAYLVHRHPVLEAPVFVAIGAAGLLAACIVPIAVR
ncbi:hypothetical protein OG912_39955 (plasmid) [Streptomyces sp. NBC_00464]|uniref:hypothetical protein n=1 Tax=Streptomyces sp. NBC_00464 TaxID=2975751 RepID=UPI002E19944B